MNDLERSELERRLLDAGRNEAVPPQLRAQMARALQGVAPAAAARAGVAWGASKLVVPVALVGLAGRGWYAAQHARRPQPLAAEVARPIPSQDSSATAVRRAQPAAADPARPARPVQSQNPAFAAPAPQPSAAEAPDGLGAENALLDRARAALREHEDARAVAILSEYQRQFARGALRPEADALQIEALLQRGASGQARQLARRFIAEHPAHPLSDRVQRLLAPAR
jgi:hypothetical protein